MGRAATFRSDSLRTLHDFFSRVLQETAYFNGMHAYRRVGVLHEGSEYTLDLTYVGPDRSIVPESCEAGTCRHQTCARVRVKARHDARKKARVT